MSANTQWYVRVLVGAEEWKEIYAITSEDAKFEASQLPDVMRVLEVKHWSEVEGGEEF